MKGMNENIILLSLHPLFFIMGNTCNSDIDEIVSIIKIGVRNINFCWINVSNNIDYESLKIENGVLREKKKLSWEDLVYRQWDKSLFERNNALASKKINFICYFNK